MPENLPPDLVSKAIRDAIQDWASKREHEIYEGTGRVIVKLLRWLVVLAITALVGHAIVSRWGS